MHQKLVSDLFLILVNNPKQPSQTLFFLPNPVPFNEQSYQNKRGLELATSRSSGYETSSEKFVYSGF